MKLFTPILLVLSEHTDHQVFLQQFSKTSQDTQDTEIVWANQLDENLSIELVRDLQQKLQFQPISVIRNVFILHLEKASPAAQQALLKLLEEPPTQTQIYATTSNLNSVLATIQSRCVVTLHNQDTFSEKNESGEQLYLRLTTANKVADIITISGEYTQKATAQQACHDLSIYIHHQMEVASTPALVAHLSSVLLALEKLSGNIAPRLVLEDMWLSWHTYS